MGELASVTQLDGRTIGNGQPGELTQVLSKLYVTETLKCRISDCLTLFSKKWASR